jgi:SAM-dependent methyltransferase
MGGVSSSAADGFPPPTAPAPADPAAPPAAGPPAMGPPTRWVTDTGQDHSQWYVERFRKMAADGADLAGEARLVDAMVARAARILDAGCGGGRVGGHLHRCGHQVVGVDVDPVLVAAAEQDHPGPRWLVGDLAVLDLAAQGEPDPFDAAVVAGNVLGFVASGTEGDVLRRLAAHLVRDGFVVIGLGTDRGYPVEAMDRDAAQAGLGLEHRFGTWDLRPWRADSEFGVSVYRRVS